MYNLTEYRDNYSKISGSFWQYCENLLWELMRTLKMTLINCEVELILTSSAWCVIICTNFVDQFPTFTIPEINLYVPVVILSTQDNAKLSALLKSGFKRTIRWNKYLSKPELLAQNENLKYLIGASFQDVNRLFVLVFEHDDANDKGYYK